jgi:hypothetical protein
METPKLGGRRRERVWLVVGLIVDTVLIIVIYWGTTKLLHEPKSSGWIATAAKYVGLGFATVLGVIGTVTDTKELRPDGGYKIRREGWIVITAIVLSSLVGAVGQYSEDKSKKAAEDEQIRKLEAISATAERSVLRFSGHLELLIEARVPKAFGGNPASTPPYEAFKAAVDELRFDIRIFDARHRRVMEILSNDPVYSGSMPSPEPNTGGRDLTFSLKPVFLDNYGIYSAKDFVNSRIQVDCFALKQVGPTGPPPHFAKAYNKSPTTAFVQSVELRDRDLGVIVASSTLRRVNDRIFVGTMKSGGLYPR